MKQMRIKRTVCLFLVAAVLAASLGVPAKRAEGAELRVHITDDAGRAAHRSIEMGTKRDNFHLEFSDKNIKDGDYVLDWTSSNPALVSVRYDSGIMRNIVEAKDEGTAVITLKVTLKDGRVLTDTCFVSVFTKRSKTPGTLKDQAAYVLKSKVSVPVTEVKLSKKEIQLGISGRKKLGKTVSPEFATNKKVKWSSSKKSVATVSQNGEVRGRKIGTTWITVKTVDGGKEAACKVKVGKKKKKNDNKGRRTVKSSALSKRYVFSFDNSSNSFDIDYGYRLPKKLLDKLVDKVFPISIYKSKKMLRRDIKKAFREAWGGTCFGINAVIVMNRCKNLNVRKYCKAKGEGYDLRYVKKPKEDKRVTNLLNYYYLSQGPLDDKAIYPEKDKNVWKKLIQAAKNKKIQMCNITSAEDDEESHNIILKKWLKKKGDWHYIETYDCNHPEYETYIRINMKKKKLKLGYVIKGKKRTTRVEQEQTYWCRLFQDFRAFEKVSIE